MLKFTVFTACLADTQTTMVVESIVVQASSHSGFLLTTTLSPGAVGSEEADLFSGAVPSAVPDNINIMLYSQKYWRELNLAAESQIAITNILAKL